MEERCGIQSDRLRPPGGATAQSGAVCAATGEPGKWEVPQAPGGEVWTPELCARAPREELPTAGRGSAPADCLLPLVLKAK